MFVLIILCYKQICFVNINKVVTKARKFTSPAGGLIINARRSPLNFLIKISYICVKFHTLLMLYKIISHI